jgi:putative spermidine/putrescine transport system ATP-binding protein
MSQQSAFLDVAGAFKAFGDSAVLKGVDLAVGQGEFVSLLGPSGCGKTTLLRMIAGLLAADRGNIRLAGSDITALPPHRRDVGVVFQSYALFPHLTVAENVAFGLQARRAPREEIDRAVRRFLELVHIAEMADRSVRALSGGQQQRVAVARALAVQPKLLLLDEPFSALDRKLRETMQIELRRLLRELGTTAIFVTHDQDEALTMSDRIAVMNRGMIEQLADPATLYRSPATRFALDFVGLSTRLEGRVQADSSGLLTIETSSGTVQARGSFRTGAQVLLGVRPERVKLSRPQAGGHTATGAPRAAHRNHLRLTVRDLVFQGARMLVYFQSPDEQPIIAELSDREAIELAPQPGLTLDFAWDIEDTLLYPAES